MIRPETARQLKEAGLKWPDDKQSPDAETTVREISAREWRLMVMVYPKERPGEGLRRPGG